MIREQQTPYVSATGYRFKYGPLGLGPDSVSGQDDSGDVLPHSYISKSLSLKDSDDLVRSLLIPNYQKA